MLPIWAKNPAAFDAEPQHIQDAWRDEVELLRSGAHLNKAGKISRPRGDPDALPPGYRVKGRGRTYRATAPDETEVAVSETKDDAIDEAWKHYRSNA